MRPTEILEALRRLTLAAQRIDRIHASPELSGALEEANDVLRACDQSGTTQRTPSSAEIAASLGMVGYDVDGMGTPYVYGTSEALRRLEVRLHSPSADRTARLDRMVTLAAAFASAGAHTADAVFRARKAYEDLEQEVGGRV